MKSQTAASTVPPKSLQHTARGTVTLVFSEGCFYLFGYLTLVLLARELGPQVYATYGVVLSVLLWIEGAGRRPIPFASAKLLAESTERKEELEKSALVLNLGLYSILFVLLWVAAPWLEAWFGIANGTLLFRLAGIDLPLFGAYTAAEAIHQGHRRFSRLALARILYAVSKLGGVVFVVYLGISVEKALLANAFATLGGFVSLLFGIRLNWTPRWRVASLVRLAVPIGFYSFALPLLGWMNLWVLQAMSSPAEAVTIGIFVGALNIARVPGFALATMTAVVLPSVARAIAQNDRPLARQYIHQALRFFLVLYLPACLVLTARPETLMQWIYSEEFVGGGILLSLLVIGCGLNIVQAILSSILIAAGAVKMTAAITSLSLLPSLLVVSIFTYLWGAVGAALSAICIPFFALLPCSVKIVQLFGGLLTKRSLLNIGMAGTLMFLVDAVIPARDGVYLLLHLVSLAVYGATLHLSGEITYKELALCLPWRKAT